MDTLGEMTIFIEEHTYDFYVNFIFYKTLYELLTSLSVVLGQIGNLDIWIYIWLLHFTDDDRKTPDVK